MFLSILLVTKKVEIVKPLCIILPQMSGIENTLKTGKNMFFFVKDDEVWD